MNRTDPTRRSIENSAERTRETEADITPQPPFESPCIVYKPFTTHGGLERYAVELASTLDAPIYTVEYDEDSTLSERAPEITEIRDVGVVGRALDRFPTGALVQRLRYEELEIPQHHDAVITIGEATKSVLHQPHQRRYHLLNMPPRWLYDQAPEDHGGWTPFSFLSRLYRAGLRTHDVTTVHRIEEFVVPSEVVARRLRTYYNRRESSVIYPPVDTGQYHCGDREGYLLVVSRLHPDKRIGEIVDALTGTGHRLKIAGTGPEGTSLQRRAGDSVEFLGFVSEKRKRELLAGCDALLFNSDREAFGIVPVEALASGKPVVGVDEGFTSHQITDGVNGIRFERGSQHMVEAVDRMYDTDWDAKVIRESAKQYDISAFRDAWLGLLHEPTGV